MRSSSPSSPPPPFRADPATNPLNRVVFAQRTLMFLNLKSRVSPKSIRSEAKRLVELSTVSNTWHDTISNYAAPLFDQWFASNGDLFAEVWLNTCSYRIGFSLNFVQHFLAAGASPNAECVHTELHVVRRAAKHADVLELLLAAGGHVEGLTVKQQQEQHPQTALMIAAQCGVPASVRLLLDGGADVHRTDRSGRTPLHYAAEGPSGEVVEMLLAAGADVHATAFNPNRPTTALFIACTSTARFDRGLSASVVRALIGGGSDVNTHVLPTLTPLIELTGNACRGNSKGDDSATLYKILLDAGADTEAGDDFGDTPLLLAVIHDAEDHVAASFVAALAKAGANLEARSSRNAWAGSTALLIACAKGLYHSVIALVAAGADLTARNEQGKTALDLARARESWGHTQCVEILEDALADREAAGARRERE